jgi:hypothetical protein
MLKQKSSDLIPATLNKIWLTKYAVLMAVKIHAAIFWVIIISSLVGQYCLHSEDGGSMLL